MKDVSLYKRKDSPYWWLRYWSEPKCKFVAESTGLRHENSSSYRAAMEMARTKSWEARADKVVAPGSHWESWVDDHLRYHYRNSPQSLRFALNAWQWLGLYLTSIRCKGPMAVTYDLGIKYLQWRTSQKKRNSGKRPCHNTALGELKLLGRIMREAIRRGFVSASPLDRLGIKKDAAKEKIELSDTHVKTIRDALHKREGHLPTKDQWMTNCFEIALHQGCRLRETSVAMNDIDETLGTIKFHAKQGKVFTTSLHNELRPLITRLRREGATRTCILPPKADMEWSRFFKGRQHQGTPGVCPEATFHCTRVTVITRLARDGVPIQQAMRFVGHADSTIHKIYQKLQPPDLGRCVKALSYGGKRGKPRKKD